MLKNHKTKALSTLFGSFAGASALALASFSTAHATPVTSATSINYGWPSTKTDDPANCKLSASFDSANTNWRNAVKNNGVSVGPNDYTIFWDEVADAASGGNDHDNDNLDTGDLVLISTHGGIVGKNNANPTALQFATTTKSNDPNGDCLVPTTQMRLGDDQSEFVDAFACHSAPRRFVSSAAFRTMTPGLHQYHGFHGTMGTGTGTSTKLDDYLDDAFDGSASWAWVENETSLDHWGGEQDVCALSAVRGSTTSDANSRAAYERYNGGTNYSDPPVNSTAVWMQWLCGCESPDGLTDELKC